MTEYQKKLQHPLWQKKRLEVLSRDSFTCILCGDKETQLHVHHTYYDGTKDPWDYPNSSLQSVCKHCHTIIYFLQEDKTITEFNVIKVIKHTRQYGSICLAVYLELPTWDLKYFLGIFSYNETLELETLFPVSFFERMKNELFNG